MGQRLTQPPGVIHSLTIGDAQRRPVKGWLKRPLLLFRLRLKVNGPADDVIGRIEIVPQQKARRHQSLATGGEAMDQGIGWKIGCRVAAAEIDVQEVPDGVTIFLAVEPPQDSRPVTRLLPRMGHHRVFERSPDGIPLLSRRLGHVGRRHGPPLNLLEHPQPVGRGGGGHHRAERLNRHPPFSTSIVVAVEAIAGDKLPDHRIDGHGLAGGSMTPRRQGSNQQGHHQTGTRQPHAKASIAPVLGPKRSAATPNRWASAR